MLSGSPNSISAVEAKDSTLVGEVVTITPEDGEPSYNTYKLKTYRCIVSVDDNTKLVSTISIQ